MFSLQCPKAEKLSLPRGTNLQPDSFAHSFSSSTKQPPSSPSTENPDISFFASSSPPSSPTTKSGGGSTEKAGSTEAKPETSSASSAIRFGDRRRKRRQAVAERKKRQTVEEEEGCTNNFCEDEQVGLSLSLKGGYQYRFVSWIWHERHRQILGKSRKWANNFLYLLFQECGFIQNPDLAYFFSLFQISLAIISFAFLKLKFLSFRITLAAKYFQLWPNTRQCPTDSSSSSLTASARLTSYWWWSQGNIQLQGVFFHWASP